MEMTAEVHDPGKTVAVTLPDTEGYQEIDPSVLNVDKTKGRMAGKRQSARPCHF